MLDHISEARARKAAIFAERASFLPDWQMCSRYLFPRAGRFTSSDRNRGGSRMNNLYDTSGTRALRVLEAGLMAGMTSPARPWFRLTTHDTKLAEFGPVKEWLDDLTVLMRNIFAQSNTYRALHSVYGEVAAFATGATLIDSDFDTVIHHTPFTAGEYGLATDDKGRPDTFVREFDMTVGQIVKKFVADPGKDKSKWDWSKVSSTVKNLYDTGRGLDSWVTVIHLIEPRVDRDYRARDARNMPWKSCYFEAAGTNKEYLRESGYRRFPVLAPRWDAKHGDVYGVTSPGIEILGYVKQLQHAQLRKAQGIDYMVKPPVVLPLSAKGQETNFLPGGVSYVDMTGPTAKVQSAYDVRIDLNAQLVDIEDIRRQINNTCYVDLFLMLANDTRSNITAREIVERHEEKLLMLGPVLERLHNELLKQKIDITFDKMIEANIVPPPPEMMQGQELNVEFVSMLAQAQRAVGASSVDKYVMSMGTVAQFKPGVLDKFDELRWADKYADMLGIDPDLIVANDKVALIQAERSKMQQAQARTQAAMEMAQTAKTAGEVDGGNLADIMGRFSGLAA